MKTSYDEIRRMCFRALDAAGAAAGIDEDSAHAAAWLEAVGMPGLQTLADALDNSDAPGRSSGLALDPSGSDRMTVAADGRSCVFFAPSIVDLLVGVSSKAGAGPVSLVLENAAHPLYLIPAAVRFCPAGARIRLTWDSGAETIEAEATRNMVTRLLPDADARHWRSGQPVSAATMTYLPPESDERAVRSDDGSTFVLTKSAVGDRLATALREGLNVDPEAHARVTAYAARILVPETEASRASGAGAGLTDND